MKTGREARWPELEDRLHEWVLDKRSKGIGISGTMIRLKAKVMVQEMNPENVEGFTGSTSWLYRFMKRKKSSFEAKDKDSSAFTTRI